ncbi:DUF6507 family protein, partial [Streptomyces xanthochromogenes]
MQGSWTAGRERGKHFVSAWDIKPSGVSGVLKKTATAAESMSKAGTAMQE